MALITVLLAVILIAAIAVTITMSARSGNATSSQQQNRLLSAIMSQTRQIKTSMEIALSNGLDLSTVTISWTVPATTFSLGAYRKIAQVAPVKATTSPGWLGWLWHGTGADNYALEIDPLTQRVCQQINQALFGSTTILTSYAEGWSNLQPVDASTEAYLDSKQEG